MHVLLYTRLFLNIAPVSQFLSLLIYYFHTVGFNMSSQHLSSETVNILLICFSKNLSLFPLICYPFNLELLGQVPKISLCNFGWDYIIFF